jgi:LAS superfamily LD-carboxypeptidase LdcB
VGGRQFPLHRLAAQAWRALVAAARADGLREPLLLLTSGFRDPEHQRRLWEDALRKYGSAEEARKWVAPPGGSAHQTGRAIDFYLGGRNSSANVRQLRTLPAYHWLVANAARFGFYPYEREPWHWEYNPPARG